MEETQNGNTNTEVWSSLEEVLKSREVEKKQASNPGWEKNVTEGFKVWHVGVLGFVCLECRSCDLMVGDEAGMGRWGWIQWLEVPVGDKELMEGPRRKRETKQWRRFLSCLLRAGSREPCKDRGLWPSGSSLNAGDGGNVSQVVRTEVLLIHLLGRAWATVG